MEKDNSIKRGIDFAARVGQTASPLRQAFSWWKGQKLNRRTLWVIAALWILNLIIIFPIFSKDLAPAFSSSSLLVYLGQFASRHLNIGQQYFYLTIIFLALSFAPVSFYLFVRRIALRHEATALIATLLYILPDPFIGNVPVLVSAVLKGDGTHVLVMSFIPFFLLYVQAFLSSGTPALFFLSVVGIAYIAVISPFSALNFLIIFLVSLMAEGFQGKLRIKITRGVVLILTAAALCFFWYYPGKLINFFTLPYIHSTIDKFLWILPAVIPAIPVAGTLAFLIFDRRGKLKPIFISLSLFLIYIVLVGINSQLGIAGLLSPERYFPELKLSSALIVSIVIIFLIELFFKRLIIKTQGRLKFFALILVFTFIVGGIGLIFVQSLILSHNLIRSEQIYNVFNENVTAAITASKLVDWHDPSFIFAGIVSTATMIFLIYILRKYPITLNKQTKA